jgi:hypothetical protein
MRILAWCGEGSSGEKSLAARPATARRQTGSPRRGISVPSIEELDIVGPVEIFAAVNRLRTLRQLALIYQIEMLSTARQRMISGESGLSLLAHGHYRALRGPVDTLLISGGQGAMQAHASGGARLVTDDSR